jgi:uncharacterized protein with NRDE domain
VAGLTNRAGTKPDATLRSRGELPLALAAHADARSAVEAFRAAISPRQFNPCWLLVGDRQRLYYLEMTAGDTPRVTRLDPGLHILENRPLDAPSPKVDLVRAALAGAGRLRGEALQELVHDVLRSHTIPAGGGSAPAPGAAPRPPETLAACVHAGAYGTRTAAVVVVPAGPGLPQARYSLGPPCLPPLVDASPFWHNSHG